MPLTTRPPLHINLKAGRLRQTLEKSFLHVLSSTKFTKVLKTYPNFLFCIFRQDHLELLRYNTSILCETTGVGAGLGERHGLHCSH